MRKIAIVMLLGAAVSINSANAEVAQVSSTRVGLLNAHHSDSYKPTAYERSFPLNSGIVGSNNKVLAASEVANVFSSAIHRDWKERLQEDETIQRVISYLGRTSINLFSDLEDSLEFGNASEWSLARGETLKGSQICRDGGGYDISVTRVDFRSLEGQVTAEDCEFSGLTVSGTVSFSYEDDNYYQPAPMRLYPLKFEFSGASISDLKGRTISYSGVASCDWRFNSGASSVTYEIQSSSSRFHFGEEFNGDLIFVRESGSVYQSDDPSWINNGLEFNEGGGTGNYPLEYPNCDYQDTSASYAGKIYSIDGIKFIGRYGQDGYTISSLNRAVRAEAWLEPKLSYAYNISTGQVLYDPPAILEAREPFAHPDFGAFGFASYALEPPTYQWAYRGEWGSEFYQETYQYDYLYSVFLGEEEGDFWSDNQFTPWGEKNYWSLGIDLDGDESNDRVDSWMARTSFWNSGSCGWSVKRTETLQVYTEYAPDELGICRKTNGFLVDGTGSLIFDDQNGDGNFELFDEDDDNDGVLDRNDQFPLDPDESVDSDFDGIGNNADTDDDNDGLEDDEELDRGTDPLRADSDGDGVSDLNDAFPINSTESLDNDSDGVGDNQDTDDDNDGFQDTDDRFPLDATEWADSDNDEIGDNADAFPLDAAETTDTDGDGIGNNADPDDDNDGFTDEEELADGTNPLSRFSCKSGCFSFDIDENSEAKALTDGLLVIRHLFGFTGDALATGAISTDATRNRAEDISALLADADSELDIDGNGESKALTDGLLLIRYLFGFTGDALIAGAVGDGATRDTSEAIEDYIKDRVPASD